MQCSCGSETVDKKVIRDKKTAGEYAECVKCGRILWRWKTEELEMELKEHNE